MVTQSALLTAKIHEQHHIIHPHRFLSVRQSPSMTALGCKHYIQLESQLECAVRSAPAQHSADLPANRWDRNPASWFSISLLYRWRGSACWPIDLDRQLCSDSVEKSDGNPINGVLSPAIYFRTEDIREASHSSTLSCRMTNRPAVVVYHPGLSMRPMATKRELSM